MSEESDLNDIKTGIILCYDCGLHFEVPEVALLIWAEKGCPNCGAGAGLLIDGEE